MVDGKGQPGGYVWQSYAEVGEVRSALGSALLHLGIQPGSAVGLYSGAWLGCRAWLPALPLPIAAASLQHRSPHLTTPRCCRHAAVNTPEWCLMDAANHAYGMISVPLYDTLGPDTGG